MRNRAGILLTSDSMAISTPVSPWAPRRPAERPAYFQAGAGIVADSVPESEYMETVNKAAAAIRAVERATRL